MNAPSATLPRISEVHLRDADLEPGIRKWGIEILQKVDAAGTPSLFSKKGLYSSLMEWAMQDPNFKTQLFRFVDVLPTLNSSAEISRHLKEYLLDPRVNLSPALRVALKAAGGASWLFGAGIKAQVTGMARQFMLGNDEEEIIATLSKLSGQNIAFTVDILGEAVVSESEADDYGARYHHLLNLLARQADRWSRLSKSNATPRGPVPTLNISVKLSALYSQIHPADPETAIEVISSRLRPLLRRAKELNAFINLDMESYVLKDLTLELFKRIFSEPEFSEGPARGLAIQAYLRDSVCDLNDLIEWARNHGKITIRLIKGAYWDYEVVFAHQKNWREPVFVHKAETDANFEKLSALLLENLDSVDAAFGTHNVRSIAHVLACAEHLGINRRDFEFQMLYGMADPIKSALIEMDCRLREYCPVGELLPGMAYLVRRLLENTSNEGFLANKFGRDASAEELLRNPADLIDPREARSHSFTNSVLARSDATRDAPHPHRRGEAGCFAFTNEPPTDFTRAPEREELSAAIKKARENLGQRHPLIINNKAVTTSEWLPSLNPANQNEVIGYSAQAGIEESNAALAAARSAQQKWGRIPANERAEKLEYLGSLLHREKASLSALEILEAGKNWAEADADVAEAIDFCNFYAAVMRELGEPQTTQAVAGESNVQHWVARGTGIIIAPWNFPLAILTGMTSAAVVAGNAVIVKPSDQTPIIGARLIELFIEAGFPAGVVNLLTGPGSKVAAHLVSHPQIDFIAFTGSKEVGLKIWEAAGHTDAGQANLKKVVCEMGGKNCIIVDHDADMDEAVAGCIMSAFGYQGQKCSALSRLIVLEEN